MNRITEQYENPQLVDICAVVSCIAAELKSGRLTPIIDARAVFIPMTVSKYIIPNAR